VDATKLPENDHEKNARFHTQLSPDYDASLAKHPGNAWVRAAFQQTVRDTVEPGCLLLDFGCGTGTDAQWYVQQGYRVLAYDNAPGMMAELERRCAKEIAAGLVVPICTTYDRFPEALERAPRPQAVVSNFAVLNHIQNLGPLFSMLAESMEPRSPMIFSVLNPFFWRDIADPWWWLPLAQSVRTGVVSCVWNEVSSYRHSMASIARATRPHFVKVGQAAVGTFLRYESDRCVWKEPLSLTERLDASLWRSFPVRYLGKFIFLIFQSNEVLGRVQTMP
jgi:SAM-dependent methyltransferase